MQKRNGLTLPTTIRIGATQTILTAVLATAAIPVWAGQQDPQDKPIRVAPVPVADAVQSRTGRDMVPELVIAGHVVLRLRTRAGGLTPEERAYNLRQRLGPILTLPDLTADDVQVRQRSSGQTASIYVRQRLLMTVDSNVSRANNTSIDALAQQWARNLQATLPRVNVAVRMSGNTSWSSESATTAVPTVGTSTSP